MDQVRGSQSLIFSQAPYIISAASVAGSKEGEGPLAKLFDLVNDDDLFGAQTWEEAESNMQKEACTLALGKAHVTAEKVRYLFGGDLLRQGIATSMGVEALQIPMFGLYGACSTSGEALALAAMSTAAGYGEYMLAVTSSHFGSAEKEFRFPLGYASQRPLSAHWTVTGSGAFLVGTRKSHVRIAGVTVGKIVDYGLKDSQNMGACMAPAAMDTIVQNLRDMEREPDEYDRIVTGDLGYVGQSILLDLVRGKGYDIRKLHLDCGMTIFDQETQDTHAGGSGCGCAAVTLASFILPKIEKGEWKRVLFVPTGALMWQAADAVLNRRRRRKKYGLCSFIYHGRADLRGGPDPAGPDEADAGKGNGPARVRGSAARLLRALRAVQRVCQVRRIGSPDRIREYTLAGSEGGCGSERIYRRLHGRLQGERGGDIRGADLRVSGVVHL